MKKSVISLFIIASFIAVTNMLKPNAAHSGENWKLKGECINREDDLWKLKKNKGSGVFKGKLSLNGNFFYKDTDFDDVEALFKEKCDL